MAGKGGKFGNREARPTGPLAKLDSRPDLAARILLNHSELWDILSSEDHGLLCELPAPHGELFTWLESQLHEHGPVSRGTLKEEIVSLKKENQNLISQSKELSNEAFFTFVALDENKKPKAVPAIIAETAEQIKYYDGALRRRQLRLILAGKMKPDDATELKALFVKD